MSQDQRLLLIGHAQHRHSPAFHRAKALMMASGNPLHIAVMVEPFTTYSLLGREVREPIRESMLNEQQRSWDDEVDHLKAKGLSATCSVIWAENPYEQISDYVRELEPLMLIKDVQHESLLKRTFVTPLDWQLLRGCEVPLHLISEVRHSKPQVVLATVDLAEPDTHHPGLNDQIIATATQLAAQCSAELLLGYVHSNTTLSMAGSGGAVADWARLNDQVRTELQQQFAALGERHQIPASRRHFITGEPITGVIQLAQTHQADVLVMGRVHRNRLDTWLGSTTEAVLDRLSGSILAIRPEVRY